MAFKQLTKEEFIRHGESAEQRSFMQTPEMAQLLIQRGNTVDYIGYTDDADHLVVSAILYSLPMKGGPHMEISSGPIVTDSSYLQPFYQALKTYAKQKGAMELIVKPYDIYQTFDSNGEATSPEQTDMIATLTDIGYQFDGLQTGYTKGEVYWHYMKDLRGLSETQLRSSFSNKGKQLVKKANTFGIKLRKLQRDELHIFKDITAATSKRRDYGDKSLDYYQKLYDSFGEQAEFMIATLNFQDYLDHVTSGYQHVLEQRQGIEHELAENPNSAKKKKELQQILKQEQTLVTRKEEAQKLIEQYGEEDQILAGSLFLYTSQETTYLFSGSYPEFNKFYAPTPLQEYAMQESIRRGIPTYNFLGIMGVFDNSDGVLRFKQNFNGYVVRRMGIFRYYPSPLKHKILHGIKQILARFKKID
ncbi:aminoacyltransferase [Streptococcus marmotae]|uniref:aminoacyltransferase n=1 Tax=Streptococcus marmotae TaxID=1825069 RepID=UPI000836CEE2|nr:aminoacyltransferase [Streptococcus marmotae]